MTVLASGVRTQVWRGLMRYWSNLRTPVAVNKFELRAAIDATDQWIEDNVPSYNNALPTEAKNNLTQIQKTMLFCIIATMRVDETFVRQLIGELD